MSLDNLLLKHQKDGEEDILCDAADLAAMEISEALQQYATKEDALVVVFPEAAGNERLLQSLKLVRLLVHVRHVPNFKVVLLLSAICSP